MASEAPGVVLIYKRMNMKGKVSARRPPAGPLSWFTGNCLAVGRRKALAGGSADFDACCSAWSWWLDCVFMLHAAQVWSISLRNATIHPDDADPRQLKILTPSGANLQQGVASGRHGGSRARGAEGVP